MNLNDLQFKTCLEIADLSIVNELVSADLSDRSITDRLITQIFSQLNSFDLDTEIGKDFADLENHLKALLTPLLDKGYITFNVSYLEGKPFIIIAANEALANLVFSENKDPVFIDSLLIDAHADVVPYSFFGNGRSIIQTDKVGNEYVFGRGANDMLSQLAVLIVLLYRLYKNNIKPPFVTISTDEEMANPQQQIYYSKIRSPAAISLEPTGNLYGGIINEIIRSKGIWFDDVIRNNLTSEQLQIALNNYFRSHCKYKDMVLSCHFDEKRLFISFAPCIFNGYELQCFFEELCRFLNAAGLSVKTAYKCAEADPYYSVVEKSFKQVILDAVRKSYGEMRIIEDNKVMTTAFQGKGYKTHALGNFFQFSLGLHSPTKRRNTIILSYPERGGRHSDFEHFKVGEPSMLLEALFDINRNVKLQPLEA